jgi:ERCC4-type nuclease
MIVDYRERDLSSAIAAAGMEHTTDNLHVGDVAIFDGSETIIERKTLSDLRASIIDGRYREQKERLKSSGLNVIYLLEDPMFVDGRILTDAEPLVKGVFISLMLSKKWKVMCTRNVQESADMLVGMEKKMVEWTSCGRGGGGMITHSKAQISKKSCKTPEDAALAALTCVRGVSVEKAKGVMDAVGSLKQLGECEVGAISDIQCGAKRRRIGTEIAGRISKMLNAHQRNSNTEMEES